MDFKLSDEEKNLTEPVKYYNDLKGKNIRKYISNILGTYLVVDSQDIQNVDEINLNSFSNNGLSLFIIKW